jgi:hypothetical protein
MAGQGSNRPAYVRADGRSVDITLECIGPDDPSNIIGNGECYKKNGGDMVIWTKHFTQYYVYNIPGTPAPVQTKPSILRGTNENVQAVVINNGARETTSRLITLRLNIMGAGTMAISEDNSFSKAFFMPFKDTLNWTLSTGLGLKNIFVRFRSKDGGTADAMASIKLVAEKEEYVPSILELISKKEDSSGASSTSILNSFSLCPLPVNAAYKDPAYKTIYLINSDCRRQIIDNEKVYFSYFDSWDSITYTTYEKISEVPEDVIGYAAFGPKLKVQKGLLAKLAKDSSVFVWYNNAWHWIFSDVVFKELKYSWSWVKTISGSLFEKYEVGEHVKRNDQAGVPSAKEASVASSLEIEPMEAKVEKQTGIRFIFTRQLRTGSVGEDVRELQKLLIRLGYLDVKESGLYGSKTSAAVKKMQKSYNLPTVGVIDKKTLNLLNKLSK